MSNEKIKQARENGSLAPNIALEAIKNTEERFVTLFPKGSDNAIQQAQDHILQAVRCLGMAFQKGELTSEFAEEDQHIKERELYLLHAVARLIRATVFACGRTGMDRVEMAAWLRLPQDTVTAYLVDTFGLEHNPASIVQNSYMKPPPMNITQAREILLEKRNGFYRIDGPIEDEVVFSESKNGRIWLEGEMDLEELEAIATVGRHQLGNDVEGYEWWRQPQEVYEQNLPFGRYDPYQPQPTIEKFTGMQTLLPDNFSFEHQNKVIQDHLKEARQATDMPSHLNKGERIADHIAAFTKYAESRNMDASIWDNQFTSLRTLAYWYVYLERMDICLTYRPFHFEDKELWNGKVEARRHCKGDAGWTDWQPITVDEYRKYVEDETFEIRFRPHSSAEGETTEIHDADRIHQIVTQAVRNRIMFNMTRNEPTQGESQA